MSFESATQAIQNIRIGWNLGNALDATGKVRPESNPHILDYEQQWRNQPIVSALPAKIRRLGFDAIRVPITWNFHFDEEGIIDEAWMNHVQEVVDWSLDAGLYCIINIHHDTGDHGWLRASEKNFQSNRALFQKLWLQIAMRFIDYPEKLLFEGFNEMLDEEAHWDFPGNEAVQVINKYNQLFVDTVRSTGGNNASRNLLCCSYAASFSKMSLTGFTMPEDRTNTTGHLIAEIHNYWPPHFTMKVDAYLPATGTYDEAIEHMMDEAFDTAMAILKPLQVPVLIGECAPIDKQNESDREQWLRHLVRIAKASHVPCVIWDNHPKGDMGFLDRNGENDAHLGLIQAALEEAL